MQRERIMKKRVLLILLSILLLAVLAVGGIGLSFYLDSRNHAYTMDVSMGPTEKTLVEEDVLSYALVNNSYAPVQIREIVVLSVYDESGTPVPAEGSAYAASLAGVEELENAGRKAVQDNQVIYVTEYAVEAGKVSFEEYFQHREETENIHHAAYTLQYTDCSFQADVILQGKCREEDEWQTLCSSTDTVGMENPAAIQPAIPDLTHAVSYQWSVAEGVAYLNGLGSIPEREILIPAWVQLAATENGYVHDPIDGVAYPVMVGDRSFSDTDVQEVTFEDGVQVENNIMGNNVTGFFQNCKSLVAVHNIPDTVTDMVFTFRGCTALQEAPVIPNSVTTMKYTFQNCTALTDVADLPDSITVMDGCFEGCTALQKAPEIPNKVTSAKSLFKNCTALTEVAALPEGITDIEGAFTGCTVLIKTPVLPDSVTNMERCFFGCSMLTEVGNIPVSVENMTSCFENCVSLSTLPGLPKRAAEYRRCFSGCTALTGDVEIPVEIMNYSQYYANLENMFNGCVNIDSVILQCCKYSDITDVWQEEIPVTFTMAHLPEGTCPGCHYVTDSYEVDGLAVHMEHISEWLVPEILQYVDEEVPNELKETCSKLTYTHDIDKYNYGRSWRPAGIAFWPEGNAYVYIDPFSVWHSKNPQMLWSSLEPISAAETYAEVMRDRVEGITPHELGHCYDYNFSTYARHSGSAEWRQLCEEMYNAFERDNGQFYSKSQYPEEMFADAVKAYVYNGGGFKESHISTEMMIYVKALFDEVA